MSAAKHTPTPWQVATFGEHAGHPAFLNIVLGRLTIAWVGSRETPATLTDEANAEFMCAAVNTHDTLTAENRELRTILESCAPALACEGQKETARRNTSTGAYLSGLAADCRALLAKGGAK